MMPEDLWATWQEVQEIRVSCKEMGLRTSAAVKFGRKFHEIKPRPSSSETNSWMSEHPELREDPYFMGIHYRSEILEFVRRNHIRSEGELIQWCVENEKDEWLLTIHNGYRHRGLPKWLFYEFSNMKRCPNKKLIPMGQWK